MVRAIYINAIAKALKIPERATNNVNVRKWIKEMVIGFNCSIAPCRNGAFIILNQEELKATVRFVDRSSRTEAIRRNGIYQPH